jgi:hypothetical protein
LQAFGPVQLLSLAETAQHFGRVAGMTQVFQDLDQDHSSTLDRHEMHEFFRR